MKLTNCQHTQPLSATVNLIWSLAAIFNDQYLIEWHIFNLQLTGWIIQLEKMFHFAQKHLSLKITEKDHINPTPQSFKPRKVSKLHKDMKY